MDHIFGDGRAPDRPRAHALEPPIILRPLRHLGFGARHLRRIAQRRLRRQGDALANRARRHRTGRGRARLAAADDGPAGRVQGDHYDTASVASLHAIATARECLGVRVREEG